MKKLINSGIPILCGVLLIFIVLLIFVQIVFREFFCFNFNWTDEIAQFCMTWLSLLGLIWANENDRHLKTGLKLHKKLNKRLIGLIDSVIALIIVGIAAVVTYQSLIFTMMEMGHESLSLPWLKMGYVFIVLPIAMFATCCSYLKIFFIDLTTVFKKD
jgi:TRAP-type C4-dicarboxylate transport system permease small subunit